MTTDESLNQLQASLADMLGEAPDVELREFANKDEFGAYAQAELLKAAGETDSEERVARLKHLLENVRHAATLKFHDKGGKSLPVYAGKLSVQAQTAWKERSTQEISLQQAAASQAPGPKGYAQKGLAADLLSSLTALLAKDGDDEGSTEGAGADDSSTDGDGDGDGSTNDGSTDDNADDNADDAGDKGDEVDKGDGAKPAKKAACPWGTGMDMNIRDVKDPDEYGNSSLRSY